MSTKERKKRKDATDFTVKVLVFVDKETKKAVKRAAKKEEISEREWWRRAAAERLERAC